VSAAIQYFIDMPSSASAIQLSGLGKAEVAALRKRAKTLGLTPETYAAQLVRDGLELDRLARTMTFDELFAPVQARFRESGMTEEELDGLVDAARTRHHEKKRSKRS
jgi:hypothetical protein